MKLDDLGDKIENDLSDTIERLNSGEITAEEAELIHTKIRKDIALYKHQSDLEYDRLYRKARKEIVKKFLPVFGAITALPEANDPYGKGIKAIKRQSKSIEAKLV